MTRICILFCSIYAILFVHRPSLTKDFLWNDKKKRHFSIIAFLCHNYLPDSFLFFFLKQIKCCQFFFIGGCFLWNCHWIAIELWIIDAFFWTLGLTSRSPWVTCRSWNWNLYHQMRFDQFGSKNWKIKFKYAIHSAYDLFGRPKECQSIENWENDA